MALLEKIKKKKENTNKTKNEVFEPHQKTITPIEKNKKNVQIFLEEKNLPSFELDTATFSVFTREVLDKQKTCEVKELGKTDLTFSVDDPRLGTIDRTRICPTCDKTNEECPGHLGIINLPVNLIHPFFRSILIPVLNSICFTCKKCRIGDHLFKSKGLSVLTGYERLKKIEALSKTEKCSNPKCSTNPEFKSEAANNDLIFVKYIIKKGKKIEDRTMKVDVIKNVLECLSDKDVNMMGFVHTHPLDFIIDFIPVIPLVARPYIERDGDIKEDYITTFYSDTLSLIVESLYYESEDKKDACYTEILFNYDHIIKNTDGDYKKSPSDVFKSIVDRIEKKEGIIRCNIMAKRCDFTARSPIGPDRSLNFGQISPPRIISELTLPVTVTFYNKKHLQELAKKGEVDYLCPSTGNLSGRKLKFDITKHKINIGDKVGRFMQNGDFAILNRQPTLHKQSMLGYQIKFQEKMSIGIHLSSTSGLNADFDGDEANIHFIQTTEAITETRIIMSAVNCIMSSTHSAPVAALVFNSILSAYLMTEDMVFFSEEEFMEGLESIYMYTDNDYVKNNYKTLFERIGKKEYTGRNLFSVLLPEGFWYKRKKDDKPNVLISNGILKRGQLTKNDVGSSANSIVHLLVKNYSTKIAGYFISGANFLLNWYLINRGFTAGVKDCYSNEHKIFKEYKDRELINLNEEISDIPEPPENADIKEKIETENKKKDITTKYQNKITDKIYSSLSPTNNILIMTDSGTKGSKGKTAAIIGSVGQIMVNNSRPKQTISNDKRWLSTFSVDDKTCESRGFCINSYFEGLNPNEFFAQAQSGRETVIDTAIKTQKIGYLQRKMIKAQEDLIVKYDGTIRNQSNMILQFNYGSGISTANMIYDKKKYGESVFSFINIENLCGTINSENGYDGYVLDKEINNIIGDINSKYGIETRFESESSGVESGEEESSESEPEITEVYEPED